VIDALKINDAIHAKDLALPKGVKCLLPEDEVILRILPPQKEEVAAPAAEGEAAATEPEVITAKKPAEGEAAAEGEKGAAPKKEQAKS
jgi:large subunit ribosomal protein L25